MLKCTGSRNSKLQSCVFIACNSVVGACCAELTEDVSKLTAAAFRNEDVYIFTLSGHAVSQKEKHNASPFFFELDI